MKVINTEEYPIKLWLEDIEDGALQQAKNLANLPFVYKWISIMPDSHQGYGMPIGGVVALENVISPNMVGVDIGCGMCAYNTGIKVEGIPQEKFKEILGNIRAFVPVGFNHHEEKQDPRHLPKLFVDPVSHPIISTVYERALYQIGTLGGGNHFIELQCSDRGELWIMIHSGSRNLGKTVADHYNEVAIELNKQFYVPNVVEKDLAFLPVNTIEGQNYIREMQYCVEFAYCNRLLMMQNVFTCIDIALGTNLLLTNVDRSGIINISHNYARLENHMGKNVWVHRKGATSARQDEIGIIPGSMGTKSYIVKGKGNIQSFTSCSHGAGRKMSRSEASRIITLEQADASMKDVVYGRWNKGRDGKLDFGEAPDAYKNIDEVMNNQTDLVDIIVELKPLAVVKG